MRGVYTSAAKCAGLTAGRTVLYLTAPSTNPVEIMSFSLTNESNATNYQMQVAIANITTLGSPSATSNTPTPHEVGDQAAASTVKVNLTSEPTTYGTTITQEGASSITGYRHEPYPDERIIIKAGTSVGFRLITNPGASTDFDVRLTFREIG